MALYIHNNYTNILTFSTTALGIPYTIHSGQNSGTCAIKIFPLFGSRFRWFFSDHLLKKISNHFTYVINYDIIQLDEMSKTHDSHAGRNNICLDDSSKVDFVEKKNYSTFLCAVYVYWDQSRPVTALSKCDWILH